MIKITIVGILVALHCGLTHAQSVYYKCPHKIIASSTADSTEPGWEAFGMEKKPHRHLHAFVTAGHPKNLGQLKPWNADTKQAKTGDIYKFESPQPDGYWIQCVYADTTAGFATRLPDGVQRCELKTPKGEMVCN